MDKFTTFSGLSKMSPPPIHPHLHQVRTFVELLAHQGHDKLQLTSVRAMNPPFKKAKIRALVRPFRVERVVFQGDVPKSSALHQSLNFLTPSTEIATFWTTQIFILLPILGRLQQVDSDPSESLSMFETHTVPCSTDLWFRLLWRCHMSISQTLAYPQKILGNCFMFIGKQKFGGFTILRHTYIRIRPFQWIITSIIQKNQKQPVRGEFNFASFNCHGLMGLHHFVNKMIILHRRDVFLSSFHVFFCLRFCKPWIFMSSCSQQLVAQNIYSPHHINGWF